MLGLVVEQQRLAETCRGQRMALSDATADLDPAPAGDFGEIESALVVEHAEVYGVLALGRERFETRLGALEHVGLALRVKAEFEQLGAKLVTEPRDEAQVAAL